MNKSIPLAISIYAHICRNLMEALLDNVCGQISKSSCKMETLSPTVSIRPEVSIPLDFIGTSSLGGNRLCRLSNMRKGRSRMLTPRDCV